MRTSVHVMPLRTGLRAATEGRLEEAERFFRIYLVEDPGSASAYRSVGCSGLTDQNPFAAGPCRWVLPQGPAAADPLNVQVSLYACSSARTAKSHSRRSTIAPFRLRSMPRAWPPACAARRAAHTGMPLLPP